MITTQLVTYIREQQALGKDEEAIAQKLLERQWKPQDIEAGFNSIGSWDRTFRYVIPGTEQAKEQPAAQVNQPAVVATITRPHRSHWGLILFVVIGLAAAALAFYLGRNGSLAGAAPASVPAQVSTDRSTTQNETSHPAVKVPAATSTSNF